jgi:hypothetical protein
MLECKKFELGGHVAVAGTMFVMWYVKPSHITFRGYGLIIFGWQFSWKASKPWSVRFGRYQEPV